MVQKYLLLAGIPLMVLCIILTINNAKEYRKSIENTLSTHSKFIFDDLNAEISQLKTYAANLSVTRWVQKVMFMQGGSLDLDRFNLLDLMDYNQSLLAYVASNNFIDEMDAVFLSPNTVFADGDCIISVDNYLDFNFSTEIQYELQNAFQGKDTKIIQGFDKDKSAIKSLFYVSRVDNILPPEKGAYLVYGINIAEIEEILNRYKRENVLSSIAIMSNDDAVPLPILHTGAINNDINYIDRSHENDMFSVKSYYPQNLLVKGIVILILRNMLIAFAVIIIFGILLFLIERSFIHFITEIKKTLNIREAVNQKIKNQKITYENLIEKVEKIVHENLQINKEVVSLNNYKMENELIKYITNPYRNTIDISDMKEEYSIELCYQYFIVINLLHYNPQERINLNWSGNLEDIVIRLEIDDHDIVLINTDNVDIYNVTFELLNSQRETLSANGYYVIISTATTQFSDIPKSYNDNLKASRNIFMDKSIHIISSQVYQNTNAHHYYPAKNEGKIVNFLLANLVDKAINELTDLLKLNMKLGLTHESIYNFFISAYYTGVKVHGNINSTYKTLENNVYEILHCKGIDDLFEWITNFYLQVGFEVSKTSDISVNEKEAVLKEKIDCFLHQNICNPNLSLSMLSDEIQVSVSHLSRKFNEIYQITFSEYINQMRINLACELLLSKENYPVAYISGKSGYTNTVSFRRSFKELLGITPTQYRDSLIAIEINK